MLISLLTCRAWRRGELALSKIGARGWHIKTIWHDEEWAKVLRRDPCVYCGAYGRGTVEHVEPRGPRSAVVNGVGACSACNGERGSAPLIYYLLWLATDRSEAFKRWNFRLHAASIREYQLLAKQRRLFDRLKGERIAPPLLVSIGDRRKHLEADSAEIQKVGNR